MTQKNNSLALIGYASGVAAGDPGCGDGPLILERSGLLDALIHDGIPSHWEAMLKPVQLATKVAIVAEICQRLAQQTQHLVMQQQKFAVMAGDHACAIGTWSGAAAAIPDKAPIGMIWIDAHMDSHTPDTTPSGNIHGMPLAALLGYGATELTQLMTANHKLQPEHVSLIGVRSYESGEAALVHDLGVRIYKMDEVQKRGINVVLQEAINRAKHGTAGFGLSLDLDGIDPIDAPGVGTPEPNGINGMAMCLALTQLRQDKHLLGVELVEFNPYHDRDQKTQTLIKDLLISIFS